MSNVATKAAELIDMLPEADQNFAYEFLKKMVRAWDPDFTRVTPSERAAIDEAEKSGFVDEQDIDWDNLEQYVT
jgi:hypothetical protein